MCGGTLWEICVKGDLVVEGKYSAGRCSGGLIRLAVGLLCDLSTLDPERGPEHRNSL